MIIFESVRGKGRTKANLCIKLSIFYAMAARNKLHKWKEKLERNWIIELLSKVIWAFMNKQNNSGIWCQPANWSAHIEEPLSCVRVLSDRCTHHHQHHHHRPFCQYVDLVNGAIVKWKAINFSILCIHTSSSRVVAVAVASVFVQKLGNWIDFPFCRYGNSIVMNVTKWMLPLSAHSQSPSLCVFLS